MLKTWFRLGHISIVVVLVMTAGSIASFFVMRTIVADQEARILHEHGAELALVLDESVQNIGLLLPLAGAAAAPGTGSAQSFAEITATLVHGPGSSVVAAADQGGKFTVVDRAGAYDGGATVTGPDQALLRRDASTHGLLTGVIGVGKTRQLVIVSSTPSGLYVLDSSPLGPVKTSVPKAGSPFSEVNLSLYAGARATPSTLLVISGGVPSGQVDHQFLTVGASRWLLLASARQPLVGSIAAWAPWFVLLVGLVAALFVTFLIEGLSRRRSYALALVDERTATLEAALSEREHLQVAEQHAREEAESANRYKNAFISRMSHELRTPLNAVIGFGQLLERQNLDVDQRDFVDHILKGGHHLLQLINEVLDIARIENGDLALSPEPVLVSELVNDALGLARPLATQYSIQMVGGREGQCDKYVFADRQRLQQILLNLLSNGVKYNRVGGTVTIACEPSAPTRLRIKVADTGYGIQADHLSRLFTPFERLGAERTDIEGTGIGLSLSRQLAEAMGGILDVDTVVGAGSTFWVELPLVEGPVERYERLNLLTGPPAPVATPVSEVDRHAVLYIEDNLANLNLVERIIAERQGIEILPAMQGRLGLDLARQHHPALILLDLHLPDMSGDEVLQELRDDPDTAAIPVVMVSADATPGQIQRLLTAGAVSYLTKPIDIDQLLAVIDDQIFAAEAPSPRSRAQV